MEVIPVILAGGGGARLWPLSQPDRPKQFLDLFGGRSLFQTTAARAHIAFPEAPIKVVCGERHAARARSELAEMGLNASSGIIAEPLGRNTGPAIALAIESLMQGGENPILAALPADHWVEDDAAFAEALQRAAALADAGWIAVLGVTPTVPSTGYGYIEQGAALSEEAYRVAAFVEKPAETLARQWLAGGRHYWNAGVFVFRASTMRAEIQRFQPGMIQSVRDFLAGDRRAYATAPHLSIDYAVMERTDKAAVAPCAFGWSDLGDWAAALERLDKDENGNALAGDAHAIDCRDSLFLAKNRPVVGIGLKNAIVVETEETVLAIDKSHSQEVRTAAALMAERQSREPSVMHRPWGRIEVLSESEDCKVKRLDIFPGQRLSLQLHRRRSEYWVAISGCAKITLGDEVFLLKPGQSATVPPLTVHRIENAGEEIFSLIEVQTGDYFGEDDIVRLEDDYGREINAPGDAALQH